uniref:NIDO domain-containing protein n=1 Tax=Pygocentrus nattereri TaxID=42514 RepID=A0A3B4EIT7_PYGNA
IVNPHIDDGGSSAVRLQNPFSFFWTHLLSDLCEWIYVNNNGYLTFDQSWKNYTPIQFNVYSGRDVIAPLWTDIDNRANGVISYNQYSNGSVLSQATRDINQYFPGVNFNASWVFVATWDRVAYFNYSGTETSFQVVLISSGHASFVLMNYGPIAPTNKPLAGYATDGTDWFTILWSNVSDHVNFSNLSNMSNVNVSGLSLPPVFYSFGSGAGDIVNPHIDDGGSSAVRLQNPFSFFGHTYSQIYVNNNGYLTFDQSWKNYTPIQFNVYSGRDIIAPLWTDIDNRANGVISYNQYSNGSVLSQATRDINQYFPGVNFNASWVFVATWDRVAYFNYSGTVRYDTV